MERTRSILILGIFLLISVSLFAIEPVSKIIPQDGAPIEISSYSSKYQKGGSYTREGIQHAVSYTNISNRKIVAVQIGFVSFDIWNEFLDRTGGVDIDDLAAGKSGSGTWIASAYSDFTFLTGVAYLAKVRFENGEIWEADLENISSELSNIEEGFDISNLKKSKK